jgi:RNA polymerase sigma factor (sigma-70 family)
MASGSPSRHPEPPLADADAAARLACRIRRGDATAESELVVRYRAGLTMLLRRRVKDAALAEDLCQDVFRIALPALREGRLQDGEKLGAYLAGIARNLASRERRRQEREQPADLSEALSESAPGPDQQLLAAERADRVRHALGKLSARDRAVLSDFYLTDTTKDTICQRLGLKPAQFDLVKWRALKRLLSAWRAREDRDE